jgi:hypothetical protein
LHNEAHLFTSLDATNPSIHCFLPVRLCLPRVTNVTYKSCVEVSEQHRSWKVGLDIQQSLFRNYDESFFPEGNAIMICQSRIRKFGQKARWAWERGMKLRWEYTTQEKTEELPMICFSPQNLHPVSTTATTIQVSDFLICKHSRGICTSRKRHMVLDAGFVEYHHIIILDACSAQCFEVSSHLSSTALDILSLLNPEELAIVLKLHDTIPNLQPIPPQPPHLSSLLLQCLPHLHPILSLPNLLTPIHALML